MWYMDSSKGAHVVRRIAAGPTHRSVYLITSRPIDPSTCRIPSLFMRVLVFVVAEARSTT